MSAQIDQLFAERSLSLVVTLLFKIMSIGFVFIEFVLLKIVYVNAMNFGECPVSLADNGLGLGEVGAFKEQMFNFAQELKPKNNC